MSRNRAVVAQRVARLPFQAEGGGASPTPRLHLTVATDTGSLYKASGWQYAPTHHGERYDANGKGYPSGHGSWDGVTQQSPKHRWIYELGGAR